MTDVVIMYGIKILSLSRSLSLTFQWSYVVR